MSEARVNNLSNESNTGGPSISGITTFSGANYFVPPVGDTAQRPEIPEKGALRFNTDIGSLEYYKGDGIGWVEVQASNDELNGGNRMIFMGGTSPSVVDVIQYITISTLGNATDFGNLVAAEMEGTATTNHLRGLYFGGDPADNEIEYVTFSSAGNATDFGDCTTTSKSGASCSDRTRGVMILGASNNVMNYITFSTTGNAVDFGDTTMVNSAGSGSSSTTRGIFAIGSSNSNYKNNIEQITISTTGNSTVFGDLTRSGVHCNSYSNATRGVFHSGYQYPTSPNFMNVIDYVTIATTGDAVDFGDSLLGGFGAGGSSSTRGVAGGGYYAGSPTGESGGFTNIIDYTQIVTTGNSTDFGDLTNVVRHIKGGSNGHGGL